MKLVFDDDVTITKEEHVALEADRIRWEWLRRQFAEANGVTLVDAAKIIDRAIVEDMKARDRAEERKKKGPSGKTAEPRNR